MEELRWLRSYESTLKVRQEQEKTRETITLLMIPVLFVVTGVVILSLGRTDLMPYLGWIGGILGVSSFIAMTLSPQSVPEDEAKPVKENLKRLLITEDAEELDRQLSSLPNCSIEVSGGSSVGITDNYVVSRYMFCGKLSYRIAKLSEIAGSRLVAAKSGAEEAGQRYVVDLLNADGDRLMAIWVNGASKMKELEEALAKACPGLALRDCKAL